MNLTDKPRKSSMEIIIERKLRHARYEVKRHIKMAADTKNHVVEGWILEEKQSTVTNLESALKMVQSKKVAPAFQVVFDTIIERLESLEERLGNVRIVCDGYHEED